MNKTIKWILIAGGAFVALIIAVLLIVPRFVDVQKYKPEIEKKIAEATGRPFAIGGDLSLSLFPWAGISFSDLHLGNPSGFQEKDFVSVKSFEVRIKLIPLIFKDIQVRRFILDGPRIVLEKNQRGRSNWEGIGKPATDLPAKPPFEKEEKPSSEAALPIKGLEVGELAITNGSLLWIDRKTAGRQEVSNIHLRLQDVSLDRPVQFVFSANVDGNPLELSGNIGPLGKEPGKGILPVELNLKALEKLEMNLKGQLVDAATRQEFDMSIQVLPFSPRELVKTFRQDFPVKTADPGVLGSFAFKATLKGNPQQVNLSDGLMKLDDSTIDISAEAKDFSKPNVAFHLKLDQIDLDRYLPTSEDKTVGEKEEKAKAPETQRKKTDYSSLRNPVLNGIVEIGKLKAHGANIQELYMKVNGKNGLFRLDPFRLKLYQGDIASDGIFDVRQDDPKTEIALKAKEIKINPLLKDLLSKDFLDGTVNAAMRISMLGDDPEKIKRSLNGQGDFRFTDGAIVGVDLTGMVRNIETTFSGSEKSTEQPRTDFSELLFPFTITRGVVDTRNTSLNSPFLRALAVGKADLVEERLDFRLEPKFIASVKGQGDTEQRTGITVPVLITGSFSSPEFRPDLKGIVQQELKNVMTDPSELKKILPVPGQKVQEGEQKPMEEKAKDLFKRIPFGQ